MIPYDVLMSAARGRQAIRRGKLAEAERWFKLAERAATIAQRLAAMEHAKQAAERRRMVFRNPL